MFVGFVLSPFLGKKLAKDPAWRALVPEWYDFTIKQEKGMTREEFQEMFINMQKELHGRAIRGEFTPENLEKIDWKKEGEDSLSAAVFPASGADTSIVMSQGWDKIHPLDEDDEDEQDDEEQMTKKEESVEKEVGEIASSQEQKEVKASGEEKRSSSEEEVHN